jgi:hypothetical protein
MYPREIGTVYILGLRAQVSIVQVVGDTPNGFRRIGIVTGGTFEGPKLRGKVLTGGSDWQFLHPDGTAMLDVRMVLETDDGVPIALTYRGVRHGPKEVLEKVNKFEHVDPSLYYFRTAAQFETAHDKYKWLDYVIAVGTGDRPPDGPIYHLHQVL